jgi:hypothetical protein
LLIRVGDDKSLGGFDQIRVESSAKTFVSRNQHQKVSLVTARVEQRMMKIFVRPIRKPTQNFHHFVGEGARGNDAILSAFELCSRNHFHGLRDLLRVLYRLDAPANV